jgi:hypothetical protein
MSRRTHARRLAAPNTANVNLRTGPFWISCPFPSLSLSLSPLLTSVSSNQLIEPDFYIAATTISGDKNGLTLITFLDLL